MKSIVFLFSLFLALHSFGQDSKKPITETFWVGGVCDMCKARIEHTLDVKGVKVATYDLATHQLTITYVPAKISRTQMDTLLNEAGHDTATSKCTDAQYAKVHACCEYRVHENHSDEDHH